MKGMKGMKGMFKKRVTSVLELALVVSLVLPFVSTAKEAVQEWEVITPAGTVAIKPIRLAPRPTTLDGKTIVLRWNGKHNGNNYLDRVAELLAEKVPSAKVIKLYENDKSTTRITGSNQESARVAKAIADLNADMVIASQAD